MDLRILLSTLTFVCEGSSVTNSPTTNWTKNKTEDKELKEAQDPCLHRYRTYCVNNGHCRFRKDLETPICRCPAGYLGKRCEHLMLGAYQLEDKATYIAIGISVGLLLSGLVGFIWCLKERRCRKPKTNYGNFSEDTAL
ncbi:epigen isoform 2-T2 [Discoglossus pictus]